MSFEFLGIFKIKLCFY